MAVQKAAGLAPRIAVVASSSTTRSTTELGIWQQLKVLAKEINILWTALWSMELLRVLRCLPLVQHWLRSLGTASRRA